MQEIQEALDERQNNIDSLAGYGRMNQLRAEPFAFESQVETESQPVDLSARSFDESFQLTNKLDNLSRNESFPVLATTEKRRQLQQSENSDNHSNDRTRNESIIVKKEAITPVRCRTLEFDFDFYCRLNLFRILVENKDTQVKNFHRY